MKTYKQIDFWGSVTLIIGFIIASLIRLDFTFIAGYFAVGAWQLISITIHRVNHWFTQKNGSRSTYQTVIAIILAALLFCGVLFLSNAELGGNIFLGFLLIMLFTAPVLAVIYTSICYVELFIAIPKRELAHLK